MGSRARQTKRDGPAAGARLIFANTAQACGEVAELIRRHDGKAVELHSKLRQSDRDKHLLAFKAGRRPSSARRTWRGAASTCRASRSSSTGTSAVAREDTPPRGPRGPRAPGRRAASLFTRNFAAGAAPWRCWRARRGPSTRSSASARRREARVAARAAGNDAGGEEEEGEDVPSGDAGGGGCERV